MGKSGLTRFGGATLALAGALYLPLVLDGWRGMEDIGTPIWQTVMAAATAHHFVLLFGLMALFVFQRQAAGWLGTVAFAGASLGNALVGGVGIVQLAILPALKGNAAAEGSLICLPFYEPATESAAGFIARACGDWDFAALNAITAGAWSLLILSSALLGLSVLLAAALPRAIGGLLVVGWLISAAGIALPLPDLVADAAYAAIAAAYLWAGCFIAVRA